MPLLHIAISSWVSAEELSSSWYAGTPCQAGRTSSSIENWGERNCALNSQKSASCKEERQLLVETVMRLYKELFRCKGSSVKHPFFISSHVMK